MPKSGKNLYPKYFKLYLDLWEIRNYKTWIYFMGDTQLQNMDLFREEKP